MIMLEVCVPALGKSYDFELDETAAVQLLVEEILEMICRKEKQAMPAQPERFFLGRVNTGEMLDREASLRDYAVRVGERLVLV